MTTLEGNKLIAEFMGLLRSKEPVAGLGHNKYWWFSKEPFLWDERICSDNELSYHKSWDWLIPVVQKIYDKKTNEKDFINIYTGHIECIEEDLLNLSIEELYDDVIELICLIK